MGDREDEAAIEARITAAGYTVCYDEGPPPGIDDEWLAAAVPADPAPPGSTDRAATGSSRLEALRALESAIFGERPSR